MSDVALSGQTAVLEVVVDPTRAKSGAAEVESALQSMSGSGAKFLGMLNSAFQGMISFIEKATSSLTAFLGIAGGAYAIKSMIDRMIDVNLVYNSFIATMTMVRGSLSAAQAEFQYITDYANRMGASVEESAKVYIRLAAALKEVDKSGQAARQVFESVAQAQAVLHLKGYETNGIFLAMEQIVSKGKVSLEEVQKQLGNRIPDAMGIASRAMGVTQKEFRDSITKGTIDPLEFVLKLANQIKIEYGSAAKEAAEMFNSQMMRMKNAVFNLYLAVGQSGAMDGLMHVIQAITAMLQDPNVGKAFGQSLNELFSGIASWISKITASDVADFFDSLGAVVTTLIDLLKNLGKAFSTTSTSGKTDMLDFADGVSTVLITITDMVLTLVAAITSVPLALNAMAQDVKFLDKKLEVFRGPNYDDELAKISADRDKAIKLSEGNDAILFMTDDSPTVKAMKKKDEIFKTLRANRDNASTQPSFSDAGFSAKQGIGRPLTDQEIADLSAKGPGAPGGGKKSIKDVFNTESTALVKAASVANLEYNNLMNNQNKIENQHLIALNAKIATDKNYAILSADKIAKLRELAVVADKVILQEKAAEEFSKTRLELNKAMYTSEQALLDVTQYRDGLAEKNQRTLQEKFTFDAIYIAMSKDMKESLMAQAVALDAVAIATRKANNIEQSRYQTMVLSLQTQRDLDNFDKGLGASKYTELLKTQDSFLKGGSNQFADIEEQSTLMADAVIRDMQNMTREMGNFKFSQDEVIRGYEFEASMIGKTSLEIQKATAEKKIYDQFRLNGIDLTKKENAGFKAQAQIMATDMVNALQAVSDRQNDWLNGAISGLATYIDGTRKAADDVSAIMTKSFKGLEDALVGFVTTGKLSFKDLANSIIADVARIVIKAQITGPLANMILGGSSSGGGGSGSGSGGGGGTLGTVSQGASIYNAASGIGGAIFGSGSGTVASWLAGTSAVAPTSVLAANAAGAVGGDALGTLIAAEGWSAGAAAGGAAVAEGGAVAAGAGASSGFTSAMTWAAANPVLLAAVAVAAAAAAFGGGKDRVIGDQNISGTLGTNNISRDVNFTKDGGWFNADTAGTWKYNLGNSTAMADGKAYQDTANVASDTALLKNITTAYATLKDGSAYLAKTLGIDAAYLKDRTQDISGSLGKTAEEIQKNLAEIFKNVGNDISAELLYIGDNAGAGFSALAKEGEDASTTLTRLSNDLTQVNAVFSLLGVAALEASGKGAAAAESLISAFGDLATMQTASKSYFDNYYTDAEKLALTTKQVSQAFADAGVVMPKTRDELRAMADAAMAAGDDKTYASIVKLSAGFASITQTATAASDAVAAQAVAQASSDRAFYVANRQAADAATAAIKAASDAAFKTLSDSVASGMQGMIRSGNAAGAMAAQMSITRIDKGQYTNKDGSFNAGAYNYASAVAQAGISRDLTNAASADALKVVNVSKFMSSLGGDSEAIKYAMGSNLASDVGLKSGTLVAQVLSPLIRSNVAQLYEQKYGASGEGIASVGAASRRLGFVSQDNQGMDVIAYRQALDGLKGSFDNGRISAEDYVSGLESANKLMGDSLALVTGSAAQQEALQRQRVAEATTALSNAGLSSIAYYFQQIGVAVSDMNAAAEKVPTALSTVTDSIGRLTSLTDVMRISYQAAMVGDVGSFSAKQMSNVANAKLVADTAATAAAAMTTADASAMAKALSTKASFSSTSPLDLRNISLLGDGIKQFDSASFESAFMRLNNALDQGVVTAAQYTDIFNQSLTAYQGNQSVVTALTTSMLNLKNVMGDFADSLLIDKTKTTLTIPQTQSELLRQYEVSKVSALTGDADAISQYKTLATALLNKNLYSTQAEYNVAFSKVFGDARSLSNYGATSAAEQTAEVVAQLKLLNDKIAVLEDELVAAMVAVAANTSDTAKGITRINTVGVTTV